MKAQNKANISYVVVLNFSPVPVSRNVHRVREYHILSVNFIGQEQVTEFFSPCINCQYLH